jgi:hypothetical protein
LPNFGHFQSELHLRNNGAFRSKFGILGGLRVSDPAKISHLMAEYRKTRNVRGFVG